MTPPHPPTALDPVVEDVEAGVAAARGVSTRTGWFHLEHAILAGLFLLFCGYAAAYFLLDVDLQHLKDWGYVGIFFIAMAGSATLVLPTPSTVAIFGSGAVLDPVLGIPAPILIGVIAGLGDAIGEFTGYGLGFAGADLLRRRRFYTTFEGWMRRRGILTVFLLSTFPNPFFDLVGAAAGSVRMRPMRFFLSTFAGKTVKDLFLAFGGSFSVGIIAGL